jgi:hypothetical protein
MAPLLDPTGGVAAKRLGVGVGVGVRLRLVVVDRSSGRRRRVLHPADSRQGQLGFVLAPPVALGLGRAARRRRRGSRTSQSSLTRVRQECLK